MYLCSELSGDVCLSWVDVSLLLGVEDGLGLHLGLMLFGLAVLAWSLRVVANLILNK